MSDASAVLLAHLRNACLEHASQIEAALGRCFEVSCRIEVGEVEPWAGDAIPDALRGSGIELRWNVAGHGVLALIPQALPLPAWCAEPNTAQDAQLRTLAETWLEAMQPPSEASCLAASSTDDIRNALLACVPSESTRLIALRASCEPPAETKADASDSPTPAAQTSPPPATIYLAGPVTLAAEPVDSLVPTEPESVARSQFADPSARRSPSSSSAGAVRAPRRLHNLPVTVVVQLASKRIEVGQLMSMAPGSLISFNKSCEDLLDLYVNNRPYCRGEAVKIGEKFGIKINEVGYRPRVEQHVLNL